MPKELTKEDTQMAKGMAILAMVALHLFCRLGDLPYQPKLYIQSTPLVYYLGLFGDMCVPIYCFCSGYAHNLMYMRDCNSYTKHIPGKLHSFLVNYWIVVLLFSGLGLVFDKTNTIPGSLSKFVGNILLFKQDYNGAWWFVVTYIFLLLISSAVAQLVNRIKSILVVIFSGAVYCASYFFYYIHRVPIENECFQWVWNQMLLLGTSQFSYVIGMIFYKNRYISKLREMMDQHSAIFLVIIHLLPFGLFLFHCWVQTVAIAPISGLGTLVCFLLWEKPNGVKKLFLYMGHHSTNIWLCHLFFYATLFTNMVYIAKYPILIYAFMLVICLVASHIIFFINGYVNCVRGTYRAMR